MTGLIMENTSRQAYRWNSKKTAPERCVNNPRRPNPSLRTTEGGDGP